MTEMFAIRLNGEEIQSEEDFHTSVKEQSGIEWYGCNLDAFDEMLSYLIPCAWGPFEVVWREADLSSDKIGHSRFSQIVGIMKEAEERFPDRFKGLTMTFKHSYFDEGQDPFLDSKLPKPWSNQ